MSTPMTEKMSFEELATSLASVGDIIETDVQLPRPATYRLRLSTPEACAYGNGLLMDKDSGWRKYVPSAQV